MKNIKNIKKRKINRYNNIIFIILGLMIILLGLPKSATNSFSELFKINNYTVYHHTLIDSNNFLGMIINNNLSNNKKILENIFDTPTDKIAITQMDCCYSEYVNSWPQITHYERLYYENKDAIFILNKRNVHDLLNSFKRWNHLDKRLLKFNPSFFRNIAGKNNDENLINFFNLYYKNVENFFKSKPSKFIIYDIETDRLSKLLPYININIKNGEDLKKLNVNKNTNVETNTQISSHLKKQYYSQIPYHILDAKMLFDMFMQNCSKSEENTFLNSEDKFITYSKKCGIILYYNNNLLVAYHLIKTVADIVKICLSAYDMSLEGKQILIDSFIELINVQNYIVEASGKLSYILRKNNLNYINDLNKIKTILQIKEPHSILINNNFVLEDKYSYHYTHIYCFPKKKIVYKNNVILFGNL